MHKTFQSPHKSEAHTHEVMKLGSKYDLLDIPRILKYKQIVWKYALSTIIY